MSNVKGPRLGGGLAIFRVARDLCISFIVLVTMVSIIGCASASSAAPPAVNHSTVTLRKVGKQVCASGMHAQIQGLNVRIPDICFRNPGLPIPDSLAVTALFDFTIGTDRICYALTLVDSANAFELRLPQKCVTVGTDR